MNQIKDKTDTEHLLGKPHNVILFNDNTHDMIEVAYQITIAINCNPERAMNIMLEAHSKGRAIVFSGTKERCELVAGILEEIRLSVKIEPA